MALNPTIVAVISSAVEAADERLTPIAEVAGMEPAAFAELWDADRNDAFARFAAGIAASEDPRRHRRRFCSSTCPLRCPYTPRASSSARC